MQNRFKEFFNIIKHKIAFFKTRNANTFLKNNINIVRVLMHDTDKLILILFLGDRITTKIHRFIAGHHKSIKMNYFQKVEAFCDWECARFTKPEKPLNGIDTWKKYYLDIDMQTIVYQFSSWTKKLEEEI